MTSETGTGIDAGPSVTARVAALFAAACNQGPGGPVVGASAEITWVSAAFTGDVLEAEAVEHVRYGRNGVTDVTVRRTGDGEVVALFRGRSLELRETPAERSET